MAHDDKGEPGRRNGKIPDTDIQGRKGGERNRAATDAGVMPPPAGEARPAGRDPRDETGRGKEQ